MAVAAARGCWLAVGLRSLLAGCWRALAPMPAVAIRAPALTPLPLLLPRLPAAEPSKGGRKVGDASKSLVPDPSKVPSSEEFQKAGNFGVVTAWCARTASSFSLLSFSLERLQRACGAWRGVRKGVCSGCSWRGAAWPGSRARLPAPACCPRPPGQPQSLFTRRRPEKLKDMTYTQFWNLVRERKVDTVSVRANPKQIVFLFLFFQT